MPKLGRLLLASLLLVLAGSAAGLRAAPIAWLEGDHYEPARPDLFLRMIRRIGEHRANVFGGR